MESEMHCLKQNQKTIADFGSEIEKLSAKLAAAHVSSGTFASEAAAANIVQPIAVEAFIDGLKDPATKFFLRARNPLSLNKAISDALECTPSTSKSTNETALWCGFQWQGQNNTGRNRGFSRGRGSYGGRGRGNYQTYRGRGGNFQNFHGRGRGSYQQNQQGSGRGSSRGGNYGGNQYQNQRGHNNPHAANIAEQNPPQQQQRHNNQQQPSEEANLIDLFR